MPADTSDMTGRELVTSVLLVREEDIRFICGQTSFFSICVT